MTKSLGVLVTLLLVVAALGVAGAAVYNSTHRGDATLTLALSGMCALLLTTATGLWANKPGGLDAQASATFRDFAEAPVKVGVQPAVQPASTATSDSGQPAPVSAARTTPVVPVAPLLAVALLLSACSAPRRSVRRST